MTTARTTPERSLRAFVAVGCGIAPLLGLGIAQAQVTSDDVEFSESRDGASRRDRTSSAPTADIFGLSIAYQAPLSLDKNLPLGGGVFYTREYFVARQTALGVHGAMRMFPDAPRHLALGYGLTIKHYLGIGSPEPDYGLYLLYGLLMQMNLLEGREGLATGHDTRLAVGYDVRADGWSPVFELGYHLTQVRGFDAETLWWPYTEVVFGTRF